MLLTLPVWVFSAHFKIATIFSILSVGTANAVIFGMVDEEKEVTQPALDYGDGLLNQSKDYVGDVFIPTSKRLLRSLTKDLKNSFEVDGFFNQMSESTKELLKGIKDFPDDLEITKEFLKETFNSEAIYEDFENVGNFVGAIGDLVIDVVDEKIPVYFDKTVDWIEKNVNTEEIINETGSLIASVIGQKPKVLIDDVEKNIKSMWSFKSDIFDYLLDGKFERIAKIWDCSKNEKDSKNCKEKTEDIIEKTEQIQEDPANIATEKNTVPPENITTVDTTVSIVPSVPVDEEVSVVMEETQVEQEVVVVPAEVPIVAPQVQPKQEEVKEVVVIQEEPKPVVKEEVKNEEVPEKKVVVVVVTPAPVPEVKAVEPPKKITTPPVVVPPKSPTLVVSTANTGGNTNIKKVEEKINTVTTPPQKEETKKSNVTEVKKTTTDNTNNQTSISTITTTKDGKIIEKVTIKKKKINKNKKNGDLFNDFFALMKGWNAKPKFSNSWDNTFKTTDVTRIFQNVKAKMDEIFKKHKLAVNKTYQDMMKILVSIAAELTEEAKLVVAESFSNIIEFGNPIGEIISTKDAGSGSTICHGKMIVGSSTQFGWILPKCNTVAKLINSEMQEVQNSFKKIIPQLAAYEQHFKLAFNDSAGRNKREKESRAEDFINVKKTLALFKTVANPLNKN